MHLGVPFTYPMSKRIAYDPWHHPNIHIMIFAIKKGKGITLLLRAYFLESYFIKFIAMIRDYIYNYYLHLF